MTGRGLVVPAVSALIFVALTVVVVATGGVDAFDLVIRHAVVSRRSSGLTAVASAWTTLGSFPVVVGLALAGGAVLRWRTRGWLVPATLAISVAVTAGIVFLVKIAVGRARPSIDTLVGTPSLDFAFPSGHTTDGTVVLLGTAVLLAATVVDRRIRVLICVVSGVLAFGVGLTRVYLGFHWPTDVLAGWSLALAVVGAAAWFVPVVAASRPTIETGSALERTGATRR